MNQLQATQHAIDYYNKFRLHPSNIHHNDRDFSYGWVVEALKYQYTNDLNRPYGHLMHHTDVSMNYLSHLFVGYQVLNKNRVTLDEFQNTCYSIMSKHFDNDGRSQTVDFSLLFS